MAILEVMQMPDQTRPKVLISADWVLERIQKGKKVRLNNAAIKGDLDLSKLDLPIQYIKRAEVPRYLGVTENVKIVQSQFIITYSMIQGRLKFGNTIFEEHILFDGTTFGFDGADLRGTIFKKGASFIDTTFKGDAYFGGATFRNVNFWGATFNEEAYFAKATFCGDTAFDRATFYGNANYQGATFSGSASFSRIKCEGGLLTFWEAKFVFPKSKEGACRRAKNVLAKAGNRDLEEYHFYGEMEAKRIQKGIRKNSSTKLLPKIADSVKTRKWSNLKIFFIHDLLEFFFIQKIFGYGVHPFWLFAWWLCFVIVFAAIYSISGGIEDSKIRHWYDYFWFSVATAATPGYALYKPVGMFKFVAGIEAILGTFMWAAFITSFARKFSR